MKISHRYVDFVLPDKDTLSTKDSRRSLADEMSVTNDVLHSAIKGLKHRASLTGQAPKKSQGRTIQAESQHYFSQKEHYDHVAAQDWLGGKPYAQKRKAELASKSGGEVVAAQYGLSITKSKEEQEAFSPRIRFDHEGSNGYHRMTPANSLFEKCYGLHCAKYGKPPPDTGVVFVNTEYAAKALASGLTTQATPAPASTPVSGRAGRYSFQRLLGRHFDKKRDASKNDAQPYIQVSPGIFAVHFKAPHTPKEMDEKLRYIGARVSSYHIELALREPLRQIKPDLRVDNLELLASFENSVAPALAELAALPSAHPAAAQASVVVALIKDLQSVLKESGALATHRNNPALANGLMALDRALHVLPTQQHDNQSFSSVYMAVMEELQVVLSTSRPYSFASYKKAAEKLVHENLDPPVQAALDPVQPSAFLATSGINAIYQSLEAARLLSGKNEIAILKNQDGKDSPLYFELAALLKQNGTTINPDASTLYATLQPNTISKDGWGGGAQIAAALQPYLDRRRKDDQPLTLILDRTVERREDLTQLLETLTPALKSGQLRILLCKSHQKFSSMGSAKVAAGNITFLAKDDKKNIAARDLLKHNERELGWMADAELQLMTHFVRSGSHEHDLFEKAVANANFLREKCFSQAGHIQLQDFSKELPFLQIRINDSEQYWARWPRFTVKSADTSQPDQVLEIAPSAMISQNLIHCRGSFGMPTTNFIDIPDLAGYEGTAFRFSLGQESKAELIEHFYMATRAMHLDQEPWDCEQICAHIDELIGQALPEQKKSQTEQMTLAQKLVLIGANEAPGLSDQERLNGTLGEMRAALKKDDDPDRPFTLNKIVSAFGLLETLTRWYSLNLETSRERSRLDPMLAELIKSGMPGVSSLGRNQIFRLQARLCQSDLNVGDFMTRHHAVETLIATMTRAATARLYFMEKCLIPDEVMKEQSRSNQRKLIELLFKPLPPEAQAAFLERHLNQPKYKLFAEACAQSALNNSQDSVTAAQRTRHAHALLMKEASR